MGKENYKQKAKKKKGNKKQEPDFVTAEKELKKLINKSEGEIHQGLHEIIKNYKVTKEFCKNVLRGEQKAQKEEEKKNKESELDVTSEKREEKKRQIISKLESQWQTCQDMVFREALEYDFKKGKHFFAFRLMEERKYLTFQDNGDMIVYNQEKGIYEQDADIVISKESQNRLKDKCTDNTTKEIINTIKRNTYVDRKITEEQPKNLKVLGNGIWDLEKKKLINFSSEYVFLTRISINYNSEADCPEFKKFLWSSLKKGSETQTQKDFNLIQEWFGYCLLNDCRFQKALLLYGSGSNGKSVLLKVLQEFLGNENVENLPLQTLESNTFATSRLFGKSANIFFDLPKSSLSSSSKFKTIVTGDTIDAEKKGKDGFKFTPTQKMMFSCNEVPRTPDMTNAFFRRWLVIKFLQEFHPGHPDRVDNLEERITTKQEMEGILNFALEGLNRLLENNQFTENMTQFEIQDFWVRNSDSVVAYAKDMIEVDLNAEILKQEIYDQYEQYCEIAGYTKQEPNSFFRRFKEIADYYEYTPGANETDRRRRIKGIKLSKSLEEIKQKIEEKKDDSQST